MRDDQYDQPQRENLMQRRLRKARGEDVPDDPQLYPAYDDELDELPRSLGSGYQSYQPRRNVGGCAQGLFYLVLGGLVALILAAVLLNQSLGNLFGGLPRLPNLTTLSVTPTPKIITSAAVVQRIQQLSRLESAAYTIKTVIDVRQGSNIPIIGDFLNGDALLLIAHGTVIAGVDLRTISPEAVSVSPDGKRISLQLPPAQIFNVALDNTKTRVYTRERGLFAPENKDLETLARQQAEQQILAAACQDGILGKATTQAEASLRQLLGLFEAEITVTGGPEGSCAEPSTNKGTPVP